MPSESIGMRSAWKLFRRAWMQATAENHTLRELVTGALHQYDLERLHGPRNAAEPADCKAEVEVRLRIPVPQADGAHQRLGRFLEALLVIAHHAEAVECAVRVGVALEQGLERLFRRVPRAAVELADAELRERVLVVGLPGEQALVGLRGFRVLLACGLEMRAAEQRGARFVVGSLPEGSSCSGGRLDHPTVGTPFVSTGPPSA